MTFVENPTNRTPQLRKQIRATLCSALLLTLFACEKSKTSTAAPADAPAYVPEQSVSAPVAEVAVVTPATPAPSTPAPDPIAPDGVFYLLAKASVVTDDGILGLNPGSKLQRKEPGTYITAAGQAITLRDDQVTNNLRLAGLAAQSDAAVQAALRNERAKTEQDVAAREAAKRAAEANAAQAPAPARTSARIAVPPPAAATAAPTGGGALGAVKSDKDNGFRDSAGYRHWTDVRGRWHTDNPGAK